MTFSPVFLRLQQEAYILRSSICVGFTELRNSNIGEKGRYYTAFYQLATGLERGAKLALILDHMVSNKLSPPGSRAVRAYGHNIKSLYNKCEVVSKNRGLEFEPDFTLDKIGERIVAFITNFALGARYANLDTLASGTPIEDPLTSWSNILNEILAEDVRRSTVEKVLREATVFAPYLEDVILVRATDLDNNPLSLEEWLSLPKLQDHASKYAVLRFSELFSPVINLICELSHEAREINIESTPEVAHIPYFPEFFYFFSVDRRSVLKKKRWP